MTCEKEQMYLVALLLVNPANNNHAPILISTPNDLHRILLVATQVTEHLIYAYMFTYFNNTHTTHNEHYNEAKKFIKDHTGYTAHTYTPYAS